MPNFVTGIFNSRFAAEAAVDNLEQLNYKRDDISVLMHDQTRAKAFAQETGTSVDAGTKAASGAKIAASIGGALGAIIMAAMAKRKDAAGRGTADFGSSLLGGERERGGAGSSSSGALRTSGDYGATSLGGVTGSSEVSSTSSGVLGTGRYEDPVGDSTLRTSATSGTQRTSDAPAPATTGAGTPTVAGPLAGILAGAGLGGLIGALVGAGIPKDVAQRYEDELAGGGILIGVDARSADESRVREILNDRSGSTSPSTMHTPSTP